MTLIGYTGSLLLSVCGVFQAWECHQTKSAQGLNNWFLFTWLGGELLLLLYTALMYLDIPLILNYSVNILALLVIVYYKVLDVRY